MPQAMENVWTERDKLPGDFGRGGENRNSVIIVVEAEIDGQTKYLLLQRSPKSKRWPGQWTSAGGKIDLNSNLGDNGFFKPEIAETAAVRELFQETGVQRSEGQLTPGRASHVYRRLTGDGGNIDYAIALYRVKLTSEEAANLKLDSDHGECRWVTREEMENMENLQPTTQELIELATNFGEGESHSEVDRRYRI